MGIKYISILVMACASCGVGGDGLNLDISQNSGVIELRLKNDTSRAMVVEGGGMLGLPENQGSINLFVRGKSKVDYHLCVFIEPSPNSKIINSGESYYVKYDVNYIRRVFCIKENEFSVRAVYSHKYGETSSESLLVDVSSRE